MSTKPCAWRQCERRGYRPQATGYRPDQTRFFRPTAHSLPPTASAMTELRWILLGASAVLLALIYWHGRRKSLATESVRNSKRPNIDPPQLTEGLAVRAPDPAPA